MKLIWQSLIYIALINRIFAAPALINAVENDHTYAQSEKNEEISSSKEAKNIVSAPFGNLETSNDPLLSDVKVASDVVPSSEEEMVVLRALKNCFERAFPGSPTSQSFNQNTRNEVVDHDFNVGAGFLGLPPEGSMFREELTDLDTVDLETHFSENSETLDFSESLPLIGDDMDLSYDESDTESSATDEITEEDKFTDSRQLCVLYSHLFRLDDLRSS